MRIESQFHTDCYEARSKALLLVRLACSAAAILAILAAAGCSKDPEQPLAECHTRVEPIVLLRQSLLTGRQKEDFDYCVSNSGVQKCRWAFLDEDTDMASCMRGAGFTRYPIARCLDSNWYTTPACFEESWRGKLRAWFK